jgi:hypothetical protein
MQLPAESRVVFTNYRFDFGVWKPCVYGTTKEHERGEPNKILARRPNAALLATLLRMDFSDESLVTELIQTPPPHSGILAETA